MNFCPNCGTRFEVPNQPVCSHCGYQMPTLPGANQPAVQPPVQAQASEPPAPPVAPGPAAPEAQAGLFGEAAPGGESAPLFEAAVGPAGGDGLFEGVPLTAGEAAPAFSVPQPAAPGEQSMPAARGEDLLELLQEVQGEAAPAAPRAPASILPETAPQAAPAAFAEDTGTFARPTAEAPAPGAPAPRAPETAFAEPAAPAVAPAPTQSTPAGLFSEAEAPASAAAPAPAAEPDLFAEAQTLADVPDLFAEAEVIEPKAAPTLFGEGQPPQAAPHADAPPVPYSAPAPQPAQPRQVYPAPAQVQNNLFEEPAAAQQEQWQQFRQEQRQEPRREAPQPAPKTKPAPSRDDRRQAAAQRAQEEARRNAPAPGYGRQDPDIYEADADMDPRRGGTRTKKQAPPVRLPDPEPVRRRSVGGTIVTWVFLVILFAALVGGATLVMLYFQNRPSKTIDTFTEAIAAQDKGAITELVKMDGVAPTDEGWTAFFAAFEKQSNLNTLKAQMLQQADDPEGNPELTYPAVTIEGRPFLLFIEKYTITIHGVDLLAPGAEPGSTVRLGSTDFAGVSTPEGELYTALMPGLYQCRVAAPGVDPSTLAAVEVLAFEVGSVNRIGESSATANLTIENALGEVSAVYVNELPVEARPEGEVLHLTGVTLGSVIRIETTHEAKPMEASVTFNDLNTTTLRFENYTDRGDGSGGEPPAASSEPPAEDSEALKAAKALSEQDINAVMATFYASYLEAVNEQSIDKIKLATDSGKTAFAERISTDANKANTFQYDSVAADAATIKPSDAGGTPTVTVECVFKYRYKPREGDDPQWDDGSNRQKVTLVRVDGQWLVSALERL